MGDVHKAMATRALVASACARGVTDAALAEDAVAVLAADVDGSGGLGGAVEHRALGILVGSVIKQN